MPEPTTTWFCDRCGREIELAEHGWVEWIDLDHVGTALPRGRGMRIVHHKPYSPRPEGCQYVRGRDFTPDEALGDDRLIEFQGPDGLMRLLELIAEQRLPTPELLEIVKRVHTPGYEHARRHFDAALAGEVLSLDVVYGYWWQDDLERVLRFAAEE